MDPDLLYAAREREGSKEIAIGGERREDVVVAAVDP